jgi:hypothetical protein
MCWYHEYSYSVEGTSTTKRIVSAEDKANGVYTFYMPDADITVRAVFRALATGETPPATNTDTNSKGKSVGVGAAFALNIAYLTVEASVGQFRAVSAVQAFRFGGRTARFGNGLRFRYGPLSEHGQHHLRR